MYMKRNEVPWNTANISLITPPMKEAPIHGNRLCPALLVEMAALHRKATDLWQGTRYVHNRCVKSVRMKAVCKFTKCFNSWDLHILFPSFAPHLVFLNFEGQLQWCASPKEGDHLPYAAKSMSSGNQAQWSHWKCPVSDSSIYTACHTLI